MAIKEEDPTKLLNRKKQDALDLSTKSPSKGGKVSIIRIGIQRLGRGLSLCYLCFEQTFSFLLYFSTFN
eukprot:1161097-Pelagomonas_calceolata.AAC.12